ncbi:pyrroline-5-carboxylate reductase [Flaviflexus equikiangi]|uniref:Pyrroline-5-carboxylate reductase n=1 Tax=Flaviflexus equikiangi TaxID=2758573 RepID=A0ABS2TFZ3_9ACTO|nr:pyrroline-5-carboxylate reductase [Flaviflexus equikiangi]MBM9433033.1 pyrroline-5-carboxylate reductase [Flaviflexus equikiangi]
MIGFLGSGNMARAIITGLIEGDVEPSSIAVTSRDPRNAEKLAHATGVDFATTNSDLVDMIGHDGTLVLAVKPYQIEAVLDEIRDALEGTAVLVVSLAAGTTIEALESGLPTGQPVVRVMPNVNSHIRAGMTGICGNEHATEAHLDTVFAMFDAIGDVAHIAEKDFPAFSALAGCSPAYTFDFIEALARAGVANGIPKAQAVRFAAQAVMGSAQLALERASDGLSPANLRDTVSSPGGTTIAGLIAMEDAGFSAAVVRGVQASIDRDHEISGRA